MITLENDIFNEVVNFNSLSQLKNYLKQNSLYNRDYFALNMLNIRGTDNLSYLDHNSFFNEKEQEININYL